MMDPPPFQQQVTFLYTRDLAGSAAFYGEVLGLPLVLDQGTCRIFQVCPNAFVGLCENPQAVANSSDVILTLVTPAVDAWYQHLLSEGVPIEKPPIYNPKYNIEHFFIRDPNGYLVEIQKFLDPTWPQAR